MQTLEVTIKVPDDYVLIKRERLEEFEESELLVTGDMKWLKEATGIKTDKTLREILYSNREEYQLDDFVRFPGDGVGNWGFLKKPMARFISDNWHLFSKKG